jgi:hypothetical protein
MELLKKIFARYCANYNGFYMWTEVDGEQIDLDDEHPDPAIVQKAEEVNNAVCSTLYEDCDEDGHYEGPDDEAIRVATEEIKKAFGDHVEVHVKIDNFSS